MESGNDLTQDRMYSGIFSSSVDQFPPCPSLLCWSWEMMRLMVLFPPKFSINPRAVAGRRAMSWGYVVLCGILFLKSACWCEDVLKVSFYPVWVIPSSPEYKVKRSHLLRIRSWRLRRLAVERHILFKCNQETVETVQKIALLCSLADLVMIGKWRINLGTLGGEKKGEKMQYLKGEG